MKRIHLLIPCFLMMQLNLLSQNYHAVQGSSNAGVLGVDNNPASIVNVADAWNFSPFSLQYKTSTNAFTVLNYSLISSPKNSLYRINSGSYDRYAYGNFNMHLFNTRIAINRRQAFAFGMNVKGYSQIKTAEYNFADTLNTLKSFLKINEGTENLEGNFKSSNWVEVFGTYSHTVWDNEISRLNGGITIKAMRGISGAFASLRNAGFSRNIQNNQASYILRTGNARYGYSSNLDKWGNGNSTSGNLKDLFVAAEGGLSFDLGLEYLVKTQAVHNYYEEDSYYDYEWKIGFSLLDVGANQYKFSAQSRALGNAKENITDRILENKFDVNGLKSFNDSLSSVLNNVQQLTGKFTIINPARLVINIDRYLYDDFYVNGELSVNLTAFAGTERLYTSELNALTVTPRWETRRLGIYLPVQFNTKKQFWIGGAFKAGPLLLGVHNWANVFAKNKFQNGGAYLALIFRPGQYTRSARDQRYNCPK
ncbi:MAG: hypothetical protein WKF89_07425 [Chitinophagaceae bacterium]